MTKITHTPRHGRAPGTAKHTTSNPQGVGRRLHKRLPPQSRDCRPLHRLNTFPSAGRNTSRPTRDTSLNGLPMYSLLRTRRGIHGRTTDPPMYDTVHMHASVSPHPPPFTPSIAGSGGNKQTQAWRARSPIHPPPLNRRFRHILGRHPQWPLRRVATTTLSLRLASPLVRVATRLPYSPSTRPWQAHGPSHLCRSKVC
jgi:hypothetical protein